MNFQNNSKLQLAYDFVHFTGRNIFLTGRAGTGKTTFLHNLKKHSPKRMVVVAPTGVAAINAGGVTIHSFFQLSFGPQLPEYQITESGNSGGHPQAKRFNREKINIIKSMDLLVIDEISMVRADLLDGIDATLRRFRNRNMPFGGVQLLMIGDLQQLAPVVKDDEWLLLRQHYDTPFFFSSNALAKTQYVSIELQYVYRQKDEKFIRLLNKIRDDQLDDKSIKALNARHQPDFNPDKAGYIILTTHNAKANQINDSRLKRLPGKLHVFDALIGGNFPEYNYPTLPKLKLKKGAQVMFVKNDPNPEKLFYNGKIGTITQIDKESLRVKCEGDDEDILVKPLAWEKMKYSLNEENKEITETVEGTFTQIPLKLAWAITIHKSQGLTFEHAIIDAQAAFAHGQVYVALSRCKSLEGLILSTPIDGNSIKHDKTVESFIKAYEKNQPDQSVLETSKNNYQQELLTELFDFSIIQRQIYYCIKLFNEHAGSLQGNPAEIFSGMNKNVKQEITEVSLKFKPQLLYLLEKEPHVEKNTILQDRVTKAAMYFSDKLNTHIYKKDFTFETDNKTVRKAVKNALDNLVKETNFQLTCLEAVKNGFVVKDYLEARAKASIEEQTVKKSRKKPAALPDKSVVHPELYEIIRKWRNSKAAEMGWEVYRVLPLRTMRELTRHLPGNKAALKAVKGFGEKKVQLFGKELLKIIDDYCTKHQLEPKTAEADEISVKVAKIPSKQISFDLWSAGKTIAEIAEERQLVLSTIEGHLAYYVGIGKIPVEQLVKPDKIAKIKNFFEENPNTTLGETKSALGEHISYSELRFVLQYLKFKVEQAEG